MVCFDKTNALNAVIGVTLIATSGLLMLNSDKIAQTVGAVALALGYLVLALAVVDRDIGSLRDPLRALSGSSTMIVIASAVLIVAGNLLSYYHVQDLLAKYDARVVKELVKDLPMIYNVLIGLGALGFVYSLAFQNGKVDYVKGALGLVAVASVHYSNYLVLRLIGTGADQANATRIAHLASYALMVIAVGYSTFC